MSKLAIKDKQFTKKDKAITSYYPEDYIYVNNFKTRLWILAVIAGGIGAYILWKIEQGLNIPTTIQGWLVEYVVPFGVCTLVVLGIYSVLGTSVYLQRYKKADKRKKDYYTALENLNNYEKQQA